MNISIRPYREGDQQSVLDLWDRVFPGSPPHNNPVRDLRTRNEIQPELFLVAIKDGMIVGTVMAGCDEQQGWIYYLGVDPDFRRQGIGTRLMKRVESTLIGLGCKELHFQIWAHKAEVQTFYETLGYIAEDRLGMWKEF
ncbi:MAG: GNAT family acetyltransferase [Anaerolineales bacterium]